MKNAMWILGCAFILGACTTAVTLGGQERKISAAGGYGGTLYEQRCPAGFVVSGIHGGAGLYVDRVGLICTSVDGVKTIALPATSGSAGDVDIAGLPEKARRLCLARERVGYALDEEEEDLDEDDESDEDDDGDFETLEEEGGTLARRAEACGRYAEAVARRSGAAQAQQWYKRALRMYRRALGESSRFHRPGIGRVSRPSARLRRPLPPTTPTIDWKSAVRKLGEFHYEISKKAVNELLADPSSLGMQARVIPNYRGGRYEGFKLVGVRPNSFYRALGIRSGDVIRSINDNPINSPNKAMELFHQLKKARTVRLEIERRRQPLTLTWEVR